MALFIPSQSLVSRLMNRLPAHVERALPLVDKVILNSNRQSAHDPLHIEITESTIRIEYEALSDQYRHFSEVFFSPQSRQQVPQWLVPVDVMNLTYCGAGATVILCRKKVAAHLQQTLLQQKVD
eukprot:c12350_g1_i1.p1 GENE.c12350_g1_i1~~c12350_g1_i1.p1  ORF type:complete len:124 (+),score=22.92 c12350_g1_i1:34-405(+)